MRWRTHLGRLALAGLICAAAGGCADAVGGQSFSCTYSCPAKGEESTHNNINASGESDAETQCATQFGTGCADFICHCTTPT